MTEKKALFTTRAEKRQFKVIEPNNPQYYRDLFPYDQVPRINFDFTEPALAPAADPLITDTTFRDGQQARPPYTVDQTVCLFKFLSRLSGSQGLIRKSEFFLYNAKDRQAVDACRNLDLPFPKITGWIRAVPEDLKLVVDMKIPETGILTSVSDYHIFMKLGLNRKKALDKYLSLVKEALSLGIAPRCHMEDVTRADIYGLVIPFAQKLKELSLEAKIPVVIRLCDTLGLGVSYPGAALPRSVPRLVRALIDEAGYQGEDLEWHGHNDFHKGFVNASTTWLYGLGSINGSLLGFGERTGNTPIEGLLIEHASLYGMSPGVDLTAITDLARYFENSLGVKIPTNYPLVGRDFNITSAGIHADGLLKNEEIYNIFDTRLLLGRAPAISINDKSGTAGLVHWLGQRLHLTGGQTIDKRNHGVIKMNRLIMKEYENGRITNMSSPELEKMARHCLPQFFQSHFDQLKAKARDLAHDLMADMIENPDIRSMEPQRQEKLMEQWVTKNPFIQWMYVTDNRGIKLTHNVVSVHDKKIFSGKQEVGFNLSDRIWFVRPMEDGQIHVTDFYTSRFTGALCITVSGPIRNQSGEIAGVLGLDIRFEDLAKMEVDPLEQADGHED